MIYTLNDNEYIQDKNITYLPEVGKEYRHNIANGRLCICVAAGTVTDTFKDSEGEKSTSMLWARYLLLPEGLEDAKIWISATQKQLKLMFGDQGGVQW